MPSEVLPSYETSGSDPDVVGVVVTFHPDEHCRDLLTVLSPQCSAVVVIDNGSDRNEVADLRDWCGATGADLVELDRNTGIGAAQNLGIEWAQSRGAQFVLLSDDDSLPPQDMVATLLGGFEAAIAKGSPVAAVGPLVGEAKPGGDQLVYVSRQWGPRRATRRELSRPLLKAAFLIASGCLIDLRSIDRVGLMDAGLFIDHVDLEWGLRARHAGYELIVVTGARMSHSLGDKTVHLAGRSQPVHVHAPIRNYYLVRNTILLIRSRVLCPRWSIGYVAWLAKYSAFNVLLADRRGERIRMVIRGVVDGLRGVRGQLGGRVSS